MNLLPLCLIIFEPYWVSSQPFLWVFKNSLFFIVLFFLYHLTPLYSLPPPSTRRPHPTQCHIIVHVHEFSFFCSIPPPQHRPPPHPSAVSLLSIYDSLSVLLVSSVCSLFHISEIIWYMSFSDWFISFSIMFSRFIYAVAKGKLFFFCGRLVFHCVIVP